MIQVNDPPGERGLYSTKWLIYMEGRGGRAPPERFAFFTIACNTEGQGILPIMDYLERLRPKGVLFSR